MANSLNCCDEGYVGQAALLGSSAGSGVNVTGQPSRRRAQLDSMLNAQDYLGRTPLHYTVIGGHVQAAKELLREKVDTRLVDYPDSKVEDLSPHITPCKGFTVLEYAKAARNFQMVKVLEQMPSSGPNTPLET